MENSGENQIITKRESGKMKKKYCIRVEGKEYVVEIEELGGAEGVEKGEVRKKEEKHTSMKEKEPFGKYETIATGEKTVVAPMPAKVVRVNCKKGEKVALGDVLIVLEAMKMENEILSPIEGVIKEVLVEEGSSVSHDDTMIVFE